MRVSRELDDEDAMMTPGEPVSVCIAILCNNEERRIEKCLASLAGEMPAAQVHVVVNGSTDRTAEVARQFRGRPVLVHEFVEGGKSRSWNRFLFDTLDAFADMHVFVDGDAEVVPGSIAALVSTLTGDDRANLASALPRNGWNGPAYRAQMRREHGVFGDLYAIKGTFLARMKARSIRLPDDLIGDDGLIAAMAKTDLENESCWDDARVAVCEGAGFLCEPVQLSRWRTVKMQHRRMINYSVRFFQNLIISEIMRAEGPAALPRSFASIYPSYAHLLRPRRSLPSWYFDRAALARVKKAAAAQS